MGYKIREARVARGMTQEELSDRSKVSRAIICGLETGKRSTTTTKTLYRLAEALGTTVDELFAAKESAGKA